MRFFFYGTLIDPEVRAFVLGEAGGWDVVPATLDGWRCVVVQGRTYPVVVPRAGAETPGVLTSDLPETAFSKLVAYEGPEYEVTVCPVRAGEETAEAHVFIGGTACRASSVSWDFDLWRRQHKGRFLARLRHGRPV